VNRWFIQGLWNASQRCRIESTEDILDARGFKLWASNQPIVPELLLKLADRELQKPIELCVRAKDPVSEAAIEKSLLDLCAQWPVLNALLKPHFQSLHDLLAQWRPNPQHLLCFSVLRHGGTDHFQHAVAVACMALALAEKLGLSQERRFNLLQAGLLHDVGLLYYEHQDDHDPENEAQHPMVGALSAIELTRCNAEVGKLILSSHERCNGTGFPRKLKADQMSQDARILLFAEAVTPHLMTTGHDVWRASVTARLIPGEFDAAMVSWLASQTKHYCATLADRLSEFMPKDDMGEKLRDLHSKLSRIMVLLAMPMGEADEVREALGPWRAQLAPLVMALRSTGVEDVLGLGQNLVPQSQAEAIELHALWQDLLQRLAAVQHCIQTRSAGHHEFETSWLVRELLRIFQSFFKEEASS
jgi:hypothetical protein